MSKCRCRSAFSAAGEALGTRDPRPLSAKKICIRCREMQTKRLRDHIIMTVERANKNQVSVINDLPLGSRHRSERPTTAPTADLQIKYYIP